MAALPECLQDFRARVAQAGARHADMPTDLVVLSRLFAYVYMRLEAAYDQLMVRWNLTAWSWFTLMVVYSRQGEEVTPSDISRVLFLARANVTRLTDDLVRRGFLHREPSTLDRRVLRLSLTEAGTALINETMPHAWDMHRAVWSALDAEQLAGAEAVFCAILQGIESCPTQTASPSAAKESA